VPAAELTVVVPTLRRAATLARCLDRLDGQGADAIVVVDDPARDDADAVARAVRGRARVVHTDAPGVSAQRNAGWRAAESELVLFLGDDVLAGPGLVAAHRARHAAEPAPPVAVLGHVTWAAELRPTAFMRFLEAEGLQFDFGAIPGDDAGWGRLYAANLSVKRALLERVGGFDEAFAFGYEELELARRLRDHGLVVRYAAEARAEHLHAQTPASYAARMATVAAAERQMVAKHPDVPPFFHALSVAAVADPATGRGRPLARVVPERLPYLGPRVHASARAAWRRELGEAFLAAWRAGAR